MVAPGKVLTGAHVVADATFVQIQKISEPDKFVARLEAICHDSDLALLTIEDPRFMAGVEVATIGELPAIRTRIAVAGFPIGGDEVSISEGVVSRVEVQRYAHSQRRMLAVTVDAAINDGNSGGPAFDGDRVVGIAFQSLEDAENLGELVPAPLIRRFLTAVENGLPHQVPSLGVGIQILDNPRLRAWLGMAEGESGILIETVQHGGSADGHIEPGDVLLAIEGHQLANNGTVRYEGRFRTQFDVLVTEPHVGDVLPVRVLRNGARLDLAIPLKKHVRLVPESRYDTRPRWFVYGGLVFQRLSLDYLKTWRKWWLNAPRELVHLYFSGDRTAERREIVILSQVLAHEINVSYELFRDECIVEVNGVRPGDFAELIALFDSAQDTVVVRTSQKGTFVFDAAEARRVNPEILARYGVPTDRSPGS